MNVDFETYSEAGYARNGVGKNARLEGALKYGIQTVGAAAYAMHPSTEVLSLAYDPHDGKGPRLWVPGLPNPYELLSHILGEGLLTAWNSAFEWLIFQYVCQHRYGWPVPRLDQMRCTMSRAKAFSLPSALANSSKIVGDEIKQADGKRLLNLFSVPRNPTKSDTSLRNFTAGNPMDAQKLYEYNIQDIVTEHEIGHHIPRLSAFELEVWLTDQAVNMRGCAVDTAALQCARNIVADATQHHTARLIEITGGTVGTISETANLREWCGLQGYPMVSVDKEHVATALDTPHIPPQVREALEIRVKLSKSSTAKLHSMRNMTCPDGRIRDMFSYAGAGRTSRWAGRGPQPHNLPRSGPDLRRCVTCHQYYGMHHTICPYDASRMSIDAEWNPDAAEQAFALIATGDRERLEHVFGDSLEVISGCLRGMFIAGPEKDLISSDYAAIEAVILAELAGEEWRKEVFRTHGRIYELSAAKITGVAMTAERHVHRGLGKIAELACFTHDTQLLTDRGYVNIKDVLLTDLLWDGVEWIKHAGVVHKGRKKILALDGVRVTPDHPVSLGASWKGAKQLVSNPSILRRALEIGSENLPSSASNTKAKRGAYLSHANAEKVGSISSVCRTSTWGNLPAALYAAVKKALIRTSNGTINTLQSSLTLNTGGVLSIGYPPPLGGVTTPKIKGIVITGVAELKCARNGELTAALFFDTLSHFLVGISHLWKWTEQIQIKDMNQEISGLSPDGRTCVIDDQSSHYKSKLTPFENVYDIVNAGPRNRFTIKTDSGHLIVHNSGYQGWIGAWKAFGADKFFDSDAKMEMAIKAWRDASPQICALWKELESATIQAVQNPGAPVTYRSLSYQVRGDVLYCLLPSGREIPYHRPLLRDVVDGYGRNKIELSYMGWNNQGGWLRESTYGGKLTENAVQAIARDIMANALVNLEKSGYAPVLHVHDEAVGEVLKGRGSIEEFESIMNQMPVWASGWPIKAIGGWRGHRYRKS